MGMVKMKHINIYGPEQDPQQTLEVLAKLACFHPDKDAERINAAAGAAETCTRRCWPARSGSSRTWAEIPLCRNTAAGSSNTAR